MHKRPRATPGGSEGESDDGAEWQQQRSRKNRRRPPSPTTQSTQMTQAATPTQTTQAATSTPQPSPRTIFPKFRVMATQEATSYAAVAALETTHPTLRITARQNHHGNFVVTPKNQEAYNLLQASTSNTFVELKPEEKTTKIVVQRYPLEMSLTHITKLPSIISAERCTFGKDKTPTRQVLAVVQGPVTDSLHLGIWGSFQVRKYIPEPLRCYNCQRYGHHQARCQLQAVCAVCSQRHPTTTCLDRLKKKETVTAKCPNCKGKHHAWNLRCPERLQRVQAAQPQTATTTRATPTAAPRPSKTRKAAAPQPQRPRRTPRRPHPLASQPESLPGPSHRQASQQEPRRRPASQPEPRPGPSSHQASQPAPQPAPILQSTPQPVEATMTWTQSAFRDMLSEFARTIATMVGASLQEDKVASHLDALMQRAAGVNNHQDATPTTSSPAPPQQTGKRTDPRLEARASTAVTVQQTPTVQETVNPQGPPETHSRQRKESENSYHSTDEMESETDVSIEEDQ